MRQTHVKTQTAQTHTHTKTQQQTHKRTLQWQRRQLTRSKRRRQRPAPSCRRWWCCLSVRHSKQVKAKWFASHDVHKRKKQNRQIGTDKTNYGKRMYNKARTDIDEQHNKTPDCQTQQQKRERKLCTTSCNTQADREFALWARGREELNDICIATQ